MDDSLSEQQQMDFYMELPPETDVIAHINVGPKYQATVPEYVGDTRPVGLDVHRAELLWHPRTLEKIPQRELDMYLEFACCASSPAGGRNKEYALHLLHMTGGNIKDAMYRLMQPTPHLPSDHPLLALSGSEAGRWTQREIQTFQQALAKYDKDFMRVSKEYEGFCPDVKAMAYPCGDYSDGCSTPGYAPRGVLPAHARLQSRVKTRSPTPDKRNSASAASPASSQGDGTEEFPCKLCGKVFYKVKSRNAHMKSHRPPDAESKRKGAPQRHTPPSPQSQRPPPGRAKLTGAHHLGELPCLEPAMLSLPNQGYVIPNM
ncbi:Zinc finger protein 541 [Amphibalanus amphitrite]|uniref:Zinc finger protein 541 n=1 Tax=Amphibalanus amphitrite TaxID=1232801 RepID=A0A6A4WU88_AMPAM|nr:Zinc finger protein 541 [Amphibalanus amphitrite]